jgi:hypothetical protein
MSRKTLQRNYGYAKSEHNHNNRDPLPVNEWSFPSDQEDQPPEFEAMYQQALDFAAKVMPRFNEKEFPNTREDIGILLNSIVSDLGEIVEAEQYGSKLGSLPYLVNEAWCTLDDLACELHDSYEVEGTEVLDKIKDRLEAWLSDRGYTAGYKSAVPQPAYLRNLSLS